MSVLIMEMDENNIFALVPRPPIVAEKLLPPVDRILPCMVAETRQFRRACDRQAKPKS